MTIQSLRMSHMSTIQCSVYRKSDGHYWTCRVATYPADLIGQVQQLQAWAAGLAIHPNFETVSIDRIEAVGPNKHFAEHTDTLRAFLDEEPMNEHVA